MKNLLMLVVVLGTGIQLCAAAKVACRNCGVRDNNIIFRCEKGHISCSKCARGRNAAESFSDGLARAFGVGGGTAQRCTFVNRYDQICDASISQKIADSAVPMSLLSDHDDVVFNFYRPGFGVCDVEMH